VPEKFKQHDKFSSGKLRQICNQRAQPRVARKWGHRVENSAHSKENQLKIYLIDGTYELFRHYYALPSAHDANGMEVAAVRGVLASVLSMVKEGSTCIGVATDHVIESFRNDLWSGYKTSEGIEPELWAQFPVLEEALVAMGVCTWPMVEFEADDALAAAALNAAKDPRVDQVVICTPDKDLAQCVRGTRVVQMDRRARMIRDEAGVIAKFGVLPDSIPDYLALVGDSADGYPGIQGWGAKSAAALLARYRHLEEIPEDWRKWEAKVTSPAKLSENLMSNREMAMLFRTLATLRTDIPVFESIDDLRWKGPTPAFVEVIKRLDPGDRSKLLVSAQALEATLNIEPSASQQK
jgi:5'-3' exonuclease